ncbi:phosphoribosylformimino-5-aminoimidazole carboxamide ribotide isomerase [Eubacterium sp.]|uniref:phosphoribosylformimino-5-aminoimidazole carboxamide ribotide isomerase n=1 Tax=Eubacterium sp. TaxID=142586 RepID=UPI0025D6FE71|nr:phosphoribosylformimino-5-aminoimidazole carboxamide ribotide isomerase [Eubacterium sp.]MCR5629510.1 phosphoribosylformimino-5-aminoimidazole carboxamide ribotide isomerase [Eubacterium sp.]
MRFRPCIDIHNGKVKQLVGGSLKDEGDVAKENFVSKSDSTYYANLYKEEGLKGGHIIILNGKDSPFYEDSKKQAVEALILYKGGMQIGGGINAANAKEFIDYGASHIIVTSYIFENGKLSYEKLMRLVDAVSKEKIVLDLSCRKKDGDYYVVVDRWQTFTDMKLTKESLKELANYCDEFLIHGVDVEGMGAGMEEDLVKILVEYVKDNKSSEVASEGKLSKVTYAGGLGSYENIEKFKEISEGLLDYTIGSALDLFGGDLEFKKVLKY